MRVSPQQFSTGALAVVGTSLVIGTLLIVQASASRPPMDGAAVSAAREMLAPQAPGACLELPQAAPAGVGGAPCAEGSPVPGTR